MSNPKYQLVQRVLNHFNAIHTILVGHKLTVSEYNEIVQMNNYLFRAIEVEPHKIPELLLADKNSVV